MKLSDLFTDQALLGFLVLVLPGFVSMRVFGLIRPSDKIALKDSLLDAVAYGLLNFSVNYFWIIPAFESTESSFYHGLIVVWALVLGPTIWPLIFAPILSFLQSKGLIVYGDKTAWDFFYQKRKPCWVVVHFADGTKIGGIFGSQSYATLYPNSGHLYLQELWALDADTGEFQGDAPVSQGIILRPNDYRFIEIKSYIDDTIDS